MYDSEKSFMQSYQVALLSLHLPAQTPGVFIVNFEHVNAYWVKWLKFHKVDVWGYTSTPPPFLLKE